MNSVFVRTYPAPPFNQKEILRYMGYRSNEADQMITQLLDDCIAEISPLLIYKVCFRTFSLSCSSFDADQDLQTDGQAGSFLDLTFMQTDSKDLAKNLAGCHELVAFAATVGIAVDRLITKYGAVSPSRALCMQAIGAERIESLCDCFNQEIDEKYRQENCFTRPRFSPGYGDFVLEAQREIFKVLDCSRKIGLSLNESLLMSPSKSVTALIGISHTQKNRCRSGCIQCTKTDCNFRRNEI